MTPADTRWKTSTALEFKARLDRIPWNRRASADSWWNSPLQRPGFGEGVSHSPESWFGNAMLHRAFEGGSPVLFRTWEGNLAVPSLKLFEVIQSTFKTRPIRIADQGGGNGHFMYSGEDVMITVSLNGQGSIAYLQMGTTSEEFSNHASLLFDRVIVPDDPQRGIVFTLARGMGGYTLNRLGLAGSPVERGNYTPEVVTGFDHIVSDLKTDSPCGRLVVLSGIPGSGKTYMVRGILTEVTTAAFVLVPAHLVESLSGPDLLPTFTSAKQEFQGPLVLIIEDADKVLVNRKTGDLNSISALLNLGDGILGSVLDIRLLCTTNAETLEMDPATRRKGRLCRHLVIDDLPAEQAAEVFHRLTGKTAKFSKPVPLADVYSKARDNGWVPPRATSADQRYPKAVML